MASESALEVSPTELAFQVKPDNYSTKQLRLFNRGSKNMAFKIKTTNPKQYFVRPNQGIVASGEKSVIHVMMGKVSEIPKEKCKDRFLVQSAVYEGDVQAAKFEWKTWFSQDNFPNGNMPKPDEIKLKCSYIIQTEGEADKARPPTQPPAEDPSSSGLRARKTPQPAAPASPPKPAQAVASKPTDSNKTAKINPVSPPTQQKGPDYTVWIIIAIVFFLIGRYTTHVAIPGLDN